MRKLIFGVAVFAFAAALAPRANALTTAFVNFETVPVIAQGPSLFASAGPEQNIMVPSVATFSGGVVLGDATNLPAQSFGTEPNLYGTASASFIPGTDPSLLSTMTIAVDPSYTVGEVSFPLFNGYTATEGYTVTAFDASTQVGQQVLDLAANTAGGHGVVDLTASAITSVTIVPNDLSAGWDFFIDSVAFNEPVSSAITPGGVPIAPPTVGPTVPLPSGFWSALPLLALLGLIQASRKWKLARQR